MKKLFALFFVGALIAGMRTVVAEGNNPLIGSWNLISVTSQDGAMDLTGEDSGIMSIQFVFNQGFTFSASYNVSGQTDSVRGTYEITSTDLLNLFIEGSSFPASYYFDGDVLVITEEEPNGDVVTMHFQRMPEPDKTELQESSVSDTPLHTEGERWEGSGFDTPEIAVLYYLDGLKTQDLDKMLGAFAWETKLEHTGLKQQIERIGAYTSSINPPFPSNSGLTGAIALERYRAQIVDSISRSFMAYLADGEKAERAIQGMPVSPLKTDEDIQNMLESFDMSRMEKLRTLDNIQFISPNLATNGKYSDSKNQANIEKDRLASGADELTDRVALFTIDGESYFFTCSVARFGDRWYLYSLSGNAGTIMGLDMNHRAFSRYPMW